SRRGRLRRRYLDVVVDAPPSAARHGADQAGRVELNTSRYSSAASITPLVASAAATPIAVAVLRLGAGRLRGAGERQGSYLIPPWRLLRWAGVSARGRQGAAAARLQRDEPLLELRGWSDSSFVVESGLEDHEAVAVNEVDQSVFLADPPR